MITVLMKADVLTLGSKKEKVSFLPPTTHISFYEVLAPSFYPQQIHNAEIVFISYGFQTLTCVCPLLVDPDNCLVFNIHKSRLSNFTLHFGKFWVPFSVIYYLEPM